MKDIDNILDEAYSLYMPQHREEIKDLKNKVIELEEKINNILEKLS